MAKLRVGVIGATDRGAYGHGLDTAFSGNDRAEIIAVADWHQRGRERAAAKLHAKNQYADYRQMLSREKLDIVCIGPRWVTDRVAMVEAAANAGCHIYCEKPLIPDLESADSIAKAVEDSSVQFQMAHQWRAAPPIRKAIANLQKGEYGKPLRIHIRPKDDHRGGGEELLVHGTHFFDLMFAIAGLPKWVSGHVQVSEREAIKQDRKEGSEPVGPIAGDSISAMFGFDAGVRGYFDSTAGLALRGVERPFDHLYGVFVECEKALLRFRQPGDVFIYPAPVVLPDLEQLEWKKQWIEDWHFTPEHKPRIDLRRTWIHYGNRFLANNLIDAIQQKASPISGIEHAVAITEVVQGVYASHFAEGRRLPIPLKERRHPLI